MRCLVAVLLLLFLAGVCVWAKDAPAAPAPYSILVDRGTVSMVPLRALVEFLEADLQFDPDDAKAFSIEYHKVYVDYNKISKEVVVDGKHMEMPVAPMKYDGSLYLPVRWLAQTYGFPVDWVNGPVVRNPDNHEEQPFPVKVLKLEVGNNSDIPGGLQVNSAAYVQLQSLSLLPGARWAENAQTGAQTVTVNGHTLSFTAYTPQVLVDGKARTLDAVPVRFADHLYVPLRFVADTLGMALQQDDAQDVFVLIDPAANTKLYIDTAQKLSHVAADFDGDGTVEHAYISQALPGVATPSMIWVAQGGHAIWEQVLGNGTAYALRKLQALDLTGDRRPELLVGCWFVGAYVSESGLAAYQWQGKQQTFRNIMGQDTEDGFLTYPSMVRGDGGILFRPAQRGKPAQLIKYVTPEPTQPPYHYSAQWYRWNGHEFAPAFSRYSRHRYEADSDALKLMMKRLRINGRVLLRGMKG